MSHQSGRPDDVTQPTAEDLRMSLRSAEELPERRAHRRAVEVGGVDESLRPIVDQAVTDLVTRIGVTPAQVVVEAAGSVTWADASCGCPEPGRAYRQVPVDGSYVRLSVGGRLFHYHGGGSRGFFLCDS